MALTDLERRILAEEREGYLKLTGRIATAAKGGNGRGAELVCIGDAAGAHCAAQGMPTGGFLLRAVGRSLIVDPGANAIGFLRRNGFDPYEITDVAATHAHNDHVGDLSLAASAALSLGLGGATDARIVVSPGLVDYGAETSTRYGFTLPAFALPHVAVISPERRRVATLDGGAMDAAPTATLAGGLTLAATPAHHGGIEGIGLVIDTPMGRIGYSGDTGYFPELDRWFAGCDLLWLNLNTLVLRAMTDVGADAEGGAETPVPNHLGYFGVCRLIEAVRPKTAIVSHFGAQLLDARDAIAEALRTRFPATEIHLARRGQVYRFARSFAASPELGRLAA